MREIIRSKLDKMDDLEQRKILKGIMEEAFEGLIDYQEEMNNRLEDRVFNEIEDEEKDYDIYTTIVKREKVELLDDFLFPILEEDKEEEVYDKQELIEKINQEAEVPVTKIFLQLDYHKIQEIITNDSKFPGTIICEDKEYSILVELRYNTEYIKEEKRLYDIFLQNSVPWRTINNPYVRKFFDVIITDYQIDEEEEITDFEEIRFDLGELEDKKHINYVPVWNIEKIYQKSEGFPLPVEDKISYDHSISLETLGLENGYLVTPNEFNIMSVKKMEDRLIITSDESNSVSWEILKVVQDNKLKNREFEFELMSNSRKNSFMNKLLQHKSKAIKTFGELNRILNSFKAVNKIKLKDVEILEDMTEEDYTYDFNSFIDDEIRANKEKRIMVLKFVNQPQHYLKYDLLSFIVSEIQMYFPEYKCKGVFV